MKRKRGTIKRVGIGNADVYIGSTLYRSVPVGGLDYKSLKAGDTVSLNWVGEKPSIQGLHEYREDASGTPASVATAATATGSTTVIETRVETLNLVDAGGGIAEPDSESQILMQSGPGITPTASGSRVTFSHSTGDIGDVHTNYTEHDQQEFVTGVWNFAAKLLVSDSSALTSTSPWAVAEVRSSDTTHLRLSYDGDNYAELSAAVDGSLTLSPSGTAVHITENLIVDKDTGLGTSSPRRTLDVRDSAAPQIRLTHTDNSVYTDLKTTEDGYFLIEPSGGRMQLDLDLEFIGSQKILTSLDSLILEPADQLHLNPLGDEVIFTNWGAGKAFESDDYASQTTGFSIAYGSTGGHCDFRSGYFDELHVKAFIAEIYEAFVGGIVVTKSKGRLSRDFVIPANAATGTLYVEDLEGWEGVQLFQDGDYVLLRYIDMSGGGLIVADVWGSVVFVQDEGGGEQSYTWTTTDDGDVDGSSVYRGAVALDYGQPASGSRGVWEATVLDQAGAPYSQVKTWETNPWTAGNWTVRTRLGNLDGISGIGLEYGLWAGQGTGSDDQYFIMSDAQADLHNMPMTFHDGTNTRIKLEPLVSSGGPYISVGNTAPSSYLGGDGFWVGNDSGTYKAFLGDADGERMQWDGDEFGIYAASGDPLFITGPDGNWMSSLMVSESLGQFLFSQANGLLLLGPHAAITPTSWTSSRGQVATLSGAFHQVQGRWAGTRALQVTYDTLNYCFNPVFGAANTTFWSDYTQSGTGGTRGLSTEWASYGTHSYKIVKAAGGLYNFGVFCQVEAAHLSQFTAGHYVTFSVDLNVPAGSKVGWMAYADDNGTVLFNDKYVEGPFVGRVVSTVGPFTTGTHEYIRGYVWVESDTGTVYVDGAQLQRYAYALPLCVGDMGNGYWWGGTAHASTSACNRTNISLDNFAYTMNGKHQFAIRTVFQVPYSSTDMTGRSYHWDIGGISDATGRILFVFYDNNQPLLYINGAYRVYCDENLTFNAGDWLDIVVNVDFDAPLYSIYINGQLAGSDATAGLTPGNYSNWRVGAAYSGAGQRGLRIQEYAVFGRTLTPDEIAALYATGKPLVDAGSTSAPGIYILDGKFAIASSTSGSRLDMNSTRLAIGNGISYGGVGCWMGLDGGTTPKLSLYADANNYLLWNGANLSWKGANTSLSAAGALTCTSGSIGGWTIDTANIQKAGHIGLVSTNNDESIWIKSNSFGNAGIQLEYNGGNPQAYIGNGSNAYLKYTTDALELVGGGGALTMNANGIGIEVDDTWSTVREYSFFDGSNHLGGLRAYSDNSIGAHYVDLWSDAHPSTDFSQVSMSAVSGSAWASMRAEAGTSSGTGKIVFNGDKAIFNCPVRVGVGTSDPTGVEDGTLFYRSDLGVLILRANNDWHVLATA